MNAMRYVFGRGRARWTPLLLLIPGMFFYFVVALGPSIATSYFSFTDATGIVGTPVNWIGFENYEEFLFLGMASRDNWDALLRTLKFCFLVSTIQFALGLLVAILLNQRLKGTRFFRTLYFFPVILGVTIQGLIWELFLYPLDGPMQQIFGLFGHSSEMLGGLPNEAFMWVVIVQIWANMGITMVIFLSGLQTIPDELVEAARIDGASRWQVFTQVTWPLLTPSVNTNLLLNIIGSLQAWVLFYLLLGYRNGTQVLGYLVFAEAFGQTSGSMTLGFRQGYGAAASIVLFLLVLVIGLGTQWYLRRREERILGAEI
jgi:raffinose/stachyose/melibiose transport system permease protein